MTEPAFQQELTAVAREYRAIGERIGEFVVGHRPLIDLIGIAILCGGHILIEGAPGTAKTIIARSMAKLSGCRFRRVQGAVDTQPADILGIRIYDPDQKEFVLKEGPIFSNVVLVDEINRLSPKTQSAFVEAMSERQVTIDGITRDLAQPFFVLATQNPYEYEGTFPLIEAQMDRFMFSARLTHLSGDEELTLVERAGRGDLDWDRYFQGLAPLTTPAAILRAMETTRRVHAELPVLQYIRDIVMSTRSHADVRLGASARASIALVQAAKTVAALDARPYAIPDDVKGMVLPVLQHRLVLTREAEMGGIGADQVIAEVLESVEVP